MTVSSILPSRQGFLLSQVSWNLTVPAQLGVFTNLVVVLASSELLCVTFSREISTPVVEVTCLKLSRVLCSMSLCFALKSQHV